MFFDRDRAQKIENLLTAEPGCSDHAWNMISLSPTLHHWWARGLWGFKFLSRQEQNGKWDVEIQFHWMPHPKGSTVHAGRARASVRPQDIIEFNDDFKNGYPAKLEAPPRHVGVNNIETNRPILTGDIFHIPFETAEEAEKFELMIRMQWAVIQIAAMSGAAGHPEFFDWNDSDDPNPRMAALYKSHMGYLLALRSGDEALDLWSKGVDEDEVSSGDESE